MFGGPDSSLLLLHGGALVCGYATVYPFTWTLGLFLELETKAKNKNLTRTFKWSMHDHHTWEDAHGTLDCISWRNVWVHCGNSFNLVRDSHTSFPRLSHHLHHTSCVLVFQLFSIPTWQGRCLSSYPYGSTSPFSNKCPAAFPPMS